MSEAERRQALLHEMQGLLAHNALNAIEELIMKPNVSDEVFRHSVQQTYKSVLNVGNFLLFLITKEISMDHIDKETIRDDLTELYMLGTVLETMEILIGAEGIKDFFRESS